MWTAKKRCCLRCWRMRHGMAVRGMCRRRRARGMRRYWERSTGLRGERKFEAGLAAEDNFFGGEGPGGEPQKCGGYCERGQCSGDQDDWWRSLSAENIHGEGVLSDYRNRFQPGLTVDGVEDRR